MDDSSKQLEDYISAQLVKGTREYVIRQTLVQHGWDPGLVNNAILAAKTNLPKGTVRGAILWLLSPVLVWVISLVVASIAGLTGMDSRLLNIIAILAGIVG